MERFVCNVLYLCTRLAAPSSNWRLLVVLSAKSEAAVWPIQKVVIPISARFRTQPIAFISTAQVSTCVALDHPTKKLFVGQGGNVKVGWIVQIFQNQMVTFVNKYLKKQTIITSLSCTPKQNRKALLSIRMWHNTSRVLNKKYVFLQLPKQVSSNLEKNGNK